MDRRKQRSQKRTAVTKEQALNFLCATMRLSKIVKPINAVRGTATGSRSPAGPRRLGTATRMSASLSRRLSAFFGSTSDQGQKAAKYAVLTPGHAGFLNRAKRSEGRIAPPSETAPVSPCEPLCAQFGAGVACVCTRQAPLKRALRRLCECDLKPLWRGFSHAIWDVHLQRISDRSGGYRRILFIAG